MYSPLEYKIFSAGIHCIPRENTKYSQAGNDIFTNRKQLPFIYHLPPIYHHLANLYKHSYFFAATLLPPP
jgi:hypothetical protein